MGDLKHYDPDQYSASLSGINLNKGLADGEWFTVEKESDDFGDVVGTDGEVTRSKSNDRRATVMLKVMQTSEVNDALSALRLLDINAPGGAGVGAFMLRDRQGRTVLTAAKAWVAATPTVALDRTATPREWKIRIADLQEFHGGS